VDRLVDESAVDRLVGHGLLERAGTILRTTQRGRLLLDSILAEIAA
jgi:coproporphyrinogen III oxidase-like Fe-S oxidoreductase